MLPATLQYPPTCQLVLARPSHLRSCPSLPPACHPPFPSPPFPPSCLPSCCGSMATQSHRPELKPTSTRNFYFPSLLRDCSQTFPKIPRARQPAYDTRPKECKLPLPRPPPPPDTHPTGIPEAWKTRPTDKCPSSIPGKARLNRSGCQEQPRLKQGIPSFLSKALRPWLPRTECRTLGPAPKSCQLTKPRLQ